MIHSEEKSVGLAVPPIAIPIAGILAMLAATDGGESRAGGHVSVPQPQQQGTGR
ncbi:hypothetical protein RJJ65_33725 [Rhizobium hidalgonense]|uniref:Uncharacterized protein n=1 Tax=Rhizobium hidalgonense TaxID=1538159 RepID=A0AAJ2H0Z7_9HYPH|nr:hypothetical protein [Rhizobium hidalgonense]MDR9777505.1 hypothetical protein [Rhizobium hidalgonense]MDR9823807.1 hypothetical protein [Rhizobium hidalgonense]QKK24079.1 hypothetical protein FFM81_012390 [Rhizobium hidalgonense]